MCIQSLGQEDPLEEEMAIHSGILACRIPEESGGLQSIGSQRVRHDWSDLACMHAQRKLTAQGRQWSVQLWLLNLPSQPLWFAIPVFLLSFLALKLVFLVALLPKLFFLRLANSPSPDLVFILFLVTGSCIANCPYFSCLGYRPSAYISLSLNGCNSLTLLEIE